MAKVQIKSVSMAICDGNFLFKNGLEHFHSSDWIRSYTTMAICVFISATSSLKRLLRATNKR